MDRAPFKLVVRSRTDNRDEEAFERSFDQEAVTIGRSNTSEVLLKDARRTVSSRHAEIRRAGQKFVLIDLGSTNGTTLNGQRLDPGLEYPLLQGDEIRIGDFGIHFYSVALADKVTPQPEQPDMATCLIDERETFHQIAQRLRVLYAEHIAEAPEQRQPLILEALREKISRLDPPKVCRLIEFLKGIFPDPEYEQQRPIQSPASPAAFPQKEFEASRTAYEGLRALARKYVNDLDDLPPPVVDAVIQRMDAVFQAMVHSIADAIKGRRQFEREFEVEATRILAWSPNPIKLAERDEDIARYLLDVRKQTDTKKVVAELEEVFRDLALHQVGLVAGFRECLRGLLKQLDPETLEAEARTTVFQIGPFKIPCDFSILVRSAAWLKFKQKHRKLSEEEVKVFETILAPHFARGYLSIQKTKARP